MLSDGEIEVERFRRRFIGVGDAFYENYLGPRTITSLNLFGIFGLFYLLAAPFTLAVHERQCDKSREICTYKRG